MYTSMIMGNSDDFQRQFAGLMKNLLHFAVTETTKLFESTVHEMRTELMRRKQSDQIKDNGIICSDQGGGMLNIQRNPCKQDKGIQCGATSAPIEEALIQSPQQDEDENRFKDLFPRVLPEGNEQFTLLFIKQEEEDMSDYTPACLLPKLAENQPLVIQCIEAPIVSPYQGLSDHLFTHTQTASPPQSVQEPAAAFETLQSQESNPSAEPCVPPHSVTPLPHLKAASFQPDSAKESTSVSPKYVASLRIEEHPRRLSARNTKSVYRRPLTLEMSHADNGLKKTNDTRFSTCHKPAEGHKEMDKKSSEQLDRNELQNQNDRQQPDMTPSSKNQCEVCELVLSSPSALKHHWEVHRAGKDSVCYVCGKILPNDKSLRSHMLIHTLGKHKRRSEDEAITKTEEADCEKNQEVLGLQQTSPQDQSRRLSARKTKSVYRRQMDLESPQHSAERFKETKDNSASTCLTPKDFEETNNSYKHVGENQLDKNQDDGDQLGMNKRPKNQCEVCQLVLSTASNLKRHWAVHRTETDGVCHKCGKIFPNHKDLKCHLFSHTLDTPQQGSDNEVGPKAEEADCKSGQELYQNTQIQPQRLSPRKSKSVYRRRIEMETIQPSVEREMEIESPDVSTSYITTEVHKTTDKNDKSKSYKNQQGRIHRDDYQCELCGRIFADAIYLRHHLISHRRNKNWVCDQCGKRFAYQKVFRRHLRTHSMFKHKQRLEDVEMSETENNVCKMDQQSLRPFQNSNQDQPKEASVFKSESLYPLWVGLETNNTSPSTNSFSSKIDKEADKTGSGDPSKIKADEHKCGVCGMCFTSVSSLMFHQSVHREKSFASDQWQSIF